LKGQDDSACNSACWTASSATAMRPAPNRRANAATSRLAESRASESTSFWTGAL
jgi:hypothetical protein